MLGTEEAAAGRAPDEIPCDFASRRYGTWAKRQAALATNSEVEMRWTHSARWTGQTPPEILSEVRVPHLLQVHLYQPIVTRPTAMRQWAGRGSSRYSGR